MTEPSNDPQLESPPAEPAAPAAPAEPTAPIADSATEPRPARALLRELLHLAVLVGGVTLCVKAVCAYADVRRAPPPPDFVQLLPADVSQDQCGPPATRDGPIVVEMVYSEEKRAWIEDAAERFVRLCPNIQVRLTAMPDLDSSDAILAGTLHPTIWAPSDELVVRSLEANWRRSSTAPLFAGESTSLVRTPLVVVTWVDRLRVLLEIRQKTGATPGPWSRNFCAGIPVDPIVANVALEDRVPDLWSTWYDETVLAPARAAAPETSEPPPRRRRKSAPPPPPPVVEYTAPFPTLDEIAGWGRVKLGHASPTRSAAGLEAVYLMAYDHLVEHTGRPAEELEPDGFAEGSAIGSEHLRADFEGALESERDLLLRWFGRCEGGLPHDPPSAQYLTDAMFHLGGEGYDGVATYEHLLFPLLDRLERNRSASRKAVVIYPNPTIVNKHPAMLMALGYAVAPVQHEAAKVWLSFLLGEEIQRRAIELGFRPANPTIKIRDYHDDANPFLKFRRYGIEFSEPLTEPPRLDGQRINALIELWRDATGKS